MKRSKPRITVTQKYAGEAKRDKYWTQWAERRMEAKHATDTRASVGTDGAVPDDSTLHVGQEPPA